MTTERAFAQANSKIEEIRDLFRLAARIERSGQVPDGEAYETAGQVYDELRSLVYGKGREKDRVEAVLIGGGPALKAVADLDDEGSPHHVRLMARDWYDPWTEVPLPGGDKALLRRFLDLHDWPSVPDSAPAAASGMEP